MSYRQFCANGHDTHVVGRTPSGCCRECNRQRVRKYYHSLSPEKKRARNEANTADKSAIRAVFRAERALDR